MLTESPVDFVRRYFDAIEAGVSSEELATYFTPDVIQESFPNRLSPKGMRRDLTQILEASVQGRRLMKSQRFEIIHALTEADEIVLEVRWSGVLAAALGALEAGSVVRAQCAIFIRLVGGRIARQRSYDCFEES